MRTRAAIPNATDAELVLAARAGNKSAFVEIVARHQTMVCGIAFGILNDFPASEDAAQETFLLAWRKIAELREPAKLRSWLAQIARHSALTQARRRRPEEPLDDRSDVTAMADEALSPDQAAEFEDEAALVRGSLEKLPELYRVPLVLFYREGESIRAVAEALKISEDAVKQRLARGREMLRDRMEGALRRVLTRTGPTAVFTITVAAAMDALCSPAAIAANAFSAGTASSSFLAAMSTSKAVATVAAVITIACIPVGYELSKTREKGAPSIAEEIASTRPELRNASPALETSALIAEWRALLEKYGTNAQAMPALYQAISELNNTFRQRAFRAALFAEWSQVDPIGGLAFLQTKKKNSSETRQFFQEWFEVNPGAAIDALLARDGAEAEVARDSLMAVARRVPERLAELVSRMPAPENRWSKEVNDAFATLAETDLARAKKSAEAVTGPNRDGALGGVASVWAGTDADEAIKWARALPDTLDRNDVIRAALFGKAAVDPAGALDLAGIIPAGGKAGYSHITNAELLIAEAAKADFETTVAWLVAHPGRFNSGDLGGLSRAVTERLNADPIGFLGTAAADGSISLLAPAIGSALLNNGAGQREMVWEWLKTQPENETTRDLRRAVIGSAAHRDISLTRSIVNDIPDSPDGRLELERLAGSLLNGGNDMRAFEEHLRNAPDRLRSVLLDRGFHYLTGDSIGDPSQWTARVNDLPPAQRQKGIEAIARALAQRSPEEGLEWAQALNDPAERAFAQAGAVAGVARTHPQIAAEWLHTMPAGMDRDRATAAFVDRIQYDLPREAWEWAGRIGDPRMRDEASRSVFKQIEERDRKLALRWLETDVFSAKTKAELLAGLGLKPGEAE